MSNKVPQIRFNGYSDAWVQRKFSDLYKKNLERNKEQFGSDRTISIATMRFKEEGNGASEDSLASYKVLREGDVAFEGHTSKQFAFGRFVLNDIGDGIMSPRFTTLRPTQDMPIAFWKQYIHYEPIMRYPIVHSTKLGTMMNELVVDEFLNQSVLVPSVAEQLKIGQFLTLFDNLIAANQRKLDLLKEQKKGYLQKMFPKNGAKVPELRFAGFADDWEERKLKDIAQFNPKTVLPDEFEYVDLESVVGTEMISHRTESKDQAPSRAQRLAQKGDVFYQTVRPYQMNNYLYDLPYDNYVFSTGYAQMRPNIDSYFLLNSVQNKQFVQQVLDRSTGTSYPAINSSDLSNIEIHVPSKLSEQQKIGAFFQSIDDTIALHQRKLDLLKEQKKGYLQKMFV